MTHNDVLRSVRYLLNISETKLIEIIRLADYEVSHAEIASFLKKEDEEGYQDCGHEVIAHFLHGLIIYKRGARNRDKDETRPYQPVEVPVTNNVVLKKLRVAFELKDTDIVDIIAKSGLKVSKTELGAFFRKPGHRNYRECGDQFLRYLLKGLTP